MGSQSIVRLTGISRYFVDKVIHIYNDYGLRNFILIEEKGSRPNHLAGQWLAVTDAHIKEYRETQKKPSLSSVKSAAISASHMSTSAHVRCGYGL